MSGTIQPPSRGGDTGRSGPRLSADLGTFLTLLTTQLRNQDPTQPMDANHSRSSWCSSRRSSRASHQPDAGTHARLPAIRPARRRRALVGRRVA
jgi:hypothetical protein